MDIVRIEQSFGRFDELLALIRSSFAYMDGIIDPPSSAHRLTSETLMQKVKDEIAFAAIDGEDLLGCIFCKPEATSLYVGKLAVSTNAQGKGVGRALLAKAEDIASSLGLTALRLETRIELTGNHQRFSTWGFTKTAENSHPGYDSITSIEMTKRLD
ncbi:GNAT family N-acetyltransferase [Agrobacterium rosae]|uniref:Acetyltransferase (GNAT) family protein n=1 Tax=Agrobacterium rosae TaxID=1972867 RepID=A0A1R3TS76_9HYPH|nr:GNAT family N-acetyltransferase [Agrobacterium rosae]SCX22469.1 Acetyltransferase (GNAT) family protein [Agrobacterium rosae]